MPSPAATSGNRPKATSIFLLEDYLHHLRYHLEQILLDR
jgi:hypothetical protein